jgi:hypothetical protein
MLALQVEAPQNVCKKPMDGFYECAFETKTRFLPGSEKPWHIWPMARSVEMYVLLRALSMALFCGSRRVRTHLHTVVHRHGR